MYNRYMVKIDPEELLTITQAAEERGTTKQAISHLVRQGKLPFIEIAGKKFISRRDLQEFTPDKGGRPSTKKGGKK
jgi:excisionase family DNA binding protein